jgi:hypothetical protein
MEDTSLLQETAHKELKENLNNIKISDGDVHQLHLINRIDRGIKDKKRLINTKNAYRWH